MMDCVATQARTRVQTGARHVAAFASTEGGFEAVLTRTGTATEEHFKELRW
jgi:hypothetical protein